MYIIYSVKYIFMMKNINLLRIFEHIFQIVLK